MREPHRFEEMRAALGLGKGEMADKLGITRDTWRRYIEGAVPTGDVILRIAELGFSLDWLLAGRPVGPDGSGIRVPSADIDEELMGRVVDGIVKLYKEENQRLAPIDQGRVAAQLYNDLRSIEDEAERRGALRYALESRRRDLRQAMIAPESSKRQA